MLDKIKPLANIFIMTLLVFISGSPIVSEYNQWIYLAAVILISCSCFVFKINLLNKQILAWTAFSSILFAIQFLFVRNVSILGDLNFLARLYIAFLCTQFLGEKFRDVYLNVLVTLSVISLIFWGISLINGGGIGFKFDRYTSLLIFNSIDLEYFRNSGPFWEPGAFQGYIILAFLLFSNKMISSIKSRPISWLILLATLLSTQSTTGYLALGCFAIGYVITHSKNFITLIVVLLFLAGVIIPATKLDFIGAKINTELINTSEFNEDDINWSRTGSMILDINNIKRHPISGNGFLMNERYIGLGEKMNGAGNGLSGAVNIFGIPFILLFFVCIYKNMSGFKTLEKLLTILILMMILTGEYFLNYPMLWCLLFINFPTKNNLTSICSEIR